MTSAKQMPDPCGFQISFQRMPSRLRAHVQGASSFVATVDYWRAILVEVRRCKPVALLLIDEMHGPALSAQEWQALVDVTAGQGLEGVRIAHVKPLGLQSVEYCEIYSREAGLDARVFDNETLADLWLRHGAD